MGLQTVRKVQDMSGVEQELRKASGDRLSSRVTILDADPEDPGDGQLWYNRSDQTLRLRVDGATRWVLMT